MDRGREVLVGKLAIGRRVLARADAIRCFNASSGEPFWELAVRQGLLARADADDLVRTIDDGSLICRGKCRAVTPLDASAPPADDKCARCGGPLYVTRGTKAAVAETWKDAGSDELKEAVSAGRAAPAAPPPVVEPAPVEPATIPPKLSDSLPSAIPIRPKKASGPTIVAELRREPIRTDAPPGFQPFTIGALEVLAPIGKGGMGSVFRARHRGLNQMVAVKVFTSHAATDPEQIARFDREVKTMAKLDHPGIVRVKGGGVVGERNGFEQRPYYIMEFVSGRDLATWAREKARSPGEVASIVARVCDIVNFFHSKLPWIVHRDLKPQNVIVAFEGDTPKICDFGLAKVEDSQLTRTGDIMGTPQFMAPEQALGQKKIGPPTDVYSLGAILYTLLVGEPPFDVSGSLAAFLGRIARETAPRARAKNAAVPPALDAIIAKCLEKDPVKRFHSANELGAALKGLNLPL